MSRPRRGYRASFVISVSSQHVVTPSSPEAVGRECNIRHRYPGLSVASGSRQSDLQEVQVLISTSAEFTDEFENQIRFLLESGEGRIVHDGQHMACFTNSGQQHVL